jgi:hypothetical protein
MLLSVGAYIGWAFLALISFLIVTFLISHIKLRIVQSKQKKSLREVFERHNLIVPRLQFGSHYWWPTFTVIFNSQKEYDRAKARGIFEEFKASIGAFYNKEFTFGNGCKIYS